jgi:hypothetical protein
MERKEDGSSVVIKEGTVRIEGRLLKHKLKIFTLMLTCTGLHLVATEERKLTTSQNIIRNNKKEYKIRDILQIYRHKTKPNVFIVDHVTRRLVIHIDTETERDQWINYIVAQMTTKETADDGAKKTKTSPLLFKRKISSKYMAVADLVPKTRTNPLLDRPKSADTSYVSPIDSIESSLAEENDSGSPSSVFDILSGEIYYSIFHYLGFKDLLKTAQVSAQFYAEAMDNKLWQEMFVYHYPRVKPVPINDREFNWSAIFKRQFQGLYISSKESSSGYKTAAQYITDHEIISAKYLQLESWMDIQHVPAVIGLLTTIEGINFSNLPLRDFPPEFVNLTRLRELNLSHCDFDEIPPVIYNLTSLQSINIDGNERITSLPSEFLQRLPNLEILHASNCNITNVPSDISKLTKLTWLYLDNNPLTVLPDAIGKLSNLEQLDVSNCKLIKLSESIAQLKKLKVLNLSFNNMKFLPASLGLLEGLKELKLEGNDWDVEFKERRGSIQLVLQYLKGVVMGMAMPSRSAQVANNMCVPITISSGKKDSV